MKHERINTANCNRSQYIELAIKYEKRACRDLRKNGYKAELVSDWTNNFDVIATREGKQVLIEVKASKVKAHDNGRAKFKKRWQWDVKKVYYTHLLHLDFPVMLYADRKSAKPELFIVPASVIRERGLKNIQISTTKPLAQYSGWLAEYRLDFDQVESCIA